MSTDVRTEPTTETDADSGVVVPPEVKRRKPGTAGPRRPATAPAAGASARRATPPVEPVESVERGSHRGRLPWVLAIVGLVGTLVFGGLWLSARGDSSSGATGGGPATSAIRSSATTFSEALTNFDGATIDRDFDRLLDLSTGEFQDQADQFFSTKTRKDLKEAQASSRGEVRSAFVQDVRGDRASVFVVVDQTIANNQSPQPKADTLRMELSLVRRDGRWQVSRVNVLQAPLAGATPTSGQGG